MGLRATSELGGQREEGLGRRNSQGRSQGPLHTQSRWALSYIPSPALAFDMKQWFRNQDSAFLQVKLRTPPVNHLPQIPLTSWPGP